MWTARQAVGGQKEDKHGKVARQACLLSYVQKVWMKNLPVIMMQFVSDQGGPAVLALFPA